MNRILRTLAATAALAVSSFAAQAADPVLTPNGTVPSSGFNLVVFDLAPGGEVTFDFDVTRNHPFFDLKIYDLGAPGDIFSVYVNGNLIGDTSTVAAHNYANLAAYNTATLSACRSVTAASTSVSSNCTDRIITPSNGYSFNDASGIFNHFDSAHTGVNTITIKSIQNDTVGGLPKDTLVAFRLICNDAKCGGTVPVPEPTTTGMLFAGLAGVGFLARRRRAAV
jgi:hypothetical protein